MFSFFSSSKPEEEEKTDNSIEVGKLKQPASANPSFLESQENQSTTANTMRGGSTKSLNQLRFHNSVAGTREANSESEPSLKRSRTVKQLGKSGKKLLNFEKTFGVSNRLIHHTWNIFMILLSIGLYLYYSTPILGGFHNEGRGLLRVPGIIIPEIPCAILYGITLMSVFDYVFVLGFLYKVSLCNMFIAGLCLGIDSCLFLFAHESYCKL